ncbi:LOW QUALITY PROTEIN: proto-oncogene FRAT1 isoform X1, partial [Cricetulus griseus]
RRLQQRRGSQPETRTGDDDPHRLLQQLVLSGNLIKEAVRRLHSRRLQLHAKLPAHPFLGPMSAPVHEPPSPGSPRAACSDPGDCRGGRGTELGTTFLSLAANNQGGHRTSLYLGTKGFTQDSTGLVEDSSLCKRDNKLRNTAEKSQIFSWGS